MNNQNLNPVEALAKRAKEASYQLSQLNREVKDKALNLMAIDLVKNASEIITANELDIKNAIENKIDKYLIDRLTLNESRIKEVAKGLSEISQLKDPIGEVIRGWVQPNGLEIEQIRVPLGVVGIIYEARPNVTVDAVGICLKSGNSVLLRGSSSAQNTNAALIKIMRESLANLNIPEDAIIQIPADSHESVKQLRMLVV